MANPDLRSSYTELKVKIRDAMDGFINDGESWINAVDEARTQLQEVTRQVQAVQREKLDLESAIIKLKPEKESLESQVDQLRKAIAAIAAVRL